MSYAVMLVATSSETELLMGGPIKGDGRIAGVARWTMVVHRGDLRVERRGSMREVVKEDGGDRQLRLLLLEMEGGELVVSGAVSLWCLFYGGTTEFVGSGLTVVPVVVVGVYLLFPLFFCKKTLAQIFIIVSIVL